MDRNEIVQRIIEIFNNNDITDSTTKLNDTINLFDHGLNSIGVIDIVVNLEEVFGFEFQDEDLPFDNFESIGKIADVVERRINYAE